MKRKNLKIVVTLVLSLILLSAGYIGAQEPVKIGVVLPMTGVAALVGEQAIRGYKIGVKLINEAGGILGGRPIKIYLEDDKGIPEEGVNVVKKLINREGIKLITGGTHSTVVLAEALVTKEADVVHMNSVAKSPAIRQQGHPRLFCVNSTNEMDAKIFCKFLTSLGIKTVAVLVENNEYGRAEMEFLKKNWTAESPTKIVAVEWFRFGDTDLTVPLTTLKAKSADCLYIAAATPNSNAAAVRQAYETGFKGIKVLAPSEINYDVVRLAGPGVEGVISADVYIHTIPTPSNKKFVETYKATFNILPEKVETCSFEGIYILAKAVDKAGTEKDADKIVKVLRENKWETPTRGTLAFDRVGQANGETIPLIVKSGQIVVYK